MSQSAETKNISNTEPFVVPVEFVAQEPLKRLLVTEETAHQLCGLHQASPQARRQGFYRLRQLLGFTMFPGRLFSYEEMQRKIRAATLEKNAIEKMKNRRGP